MEIMWKNKSYENFKSNISSNYYDKPNIIGESRKLPNYGRCTCYIKCKIAMAKAAFKIKMKF
jgi:hypothetical protein